MSNQDKRFQSRQPSTFKQVNVGRSVVLNDTYLMENHPKMQLEAITLETMQRAESEAIRLVQSAQRESQEILEAARQRAAQIVQEEGIDKRNAIVEEAYREGYQNGLENGLNQMAMEVADKLMLAEQVVQQAFEAERRILLGQQHDLVSLVQYILERVLRDELATRPERLGQLIESALENIPLTGQARIVMHPETLKTLQSFSAPLVERWREIHHLQFKLDPSCSLTQIYLETTESAFELSPESQAVRYLKAVEDQLLATPPVLSEAELPPENEAVSMDVMPEPESADPQAALSELPETSEAVEEPAFSEPEAFMEPEENLPEPLPAEAGPEVTPWLDQLEELPQPIDEAVQPDDALPEDEA